MPEAYIDTLTVRSFDDSDSAFHELVAGSSKRIDQAEKHLRERAVRIGRKHA